MCANECAKDRKQARHPISSITFVSFAFALEPSRGHGINKSTLHSSILAASPKVFPELPILLVLALQHSTQGLIQACAHAQTILVIILDVQFIEDTCTNPRLMGEGFVDDDASCPYVYFMSLSGVFPQH